MKLFIKVFAICLIAGYSIGFGAKKAPFHETRKSTKHLHMMQDKSTDLSSLTNPTVTPIRTYQSSRDHNYSQFTLVDSSMNGYGLIVAPTRPIDVTDDGWLMVYRQFYQYPSAPGFVNSGQLGAAFSANGTNWTNYTNINQSGSMHGGSEGMSRYPSGVMSQSFPYAIWNEYTTQAATYGGRPYYAWDQFGFDGGSWVMPEQTDPLWNTSKDLWVGSPAHSVDASGQDHFNITYNDWTRNDRWLFTSEYVDPSGIIIFAPEFKIFDETEWFVGGDDEGSYTSTPVLDCNDNGVCVAAVTAYWSGADYGYSIYDNTHTLMFRVSEDHGLTWTNTGYYDDVPYYSITDNLLDHLINSGNFILTDYTDECTGETEATIEAFHTYDFDVRVDSEGNLHFIVGIIPASTTYFWYSEGAGYYDFTINMENLSNPGSPCNAGLEDCSNATGWTYSLVMEMGDSWWQDTPAGFVYWQNVHPSLAVSAEDSDVLYVVGSKIVEGPMEDPDGDPCSGDELYPEQSEDLLVAKSTNGGLNWWMAENFTQTASDPNTEYDDTPELDAHVARDATNDEVYVMFQVPKYEWNTTGDPDPEDHMTRVYAGVIGLVHEPQIIDDGDANCDDNVSVADIVTIVNHILGNISIDCTNDLGGSGFSGADINNDDLITVNDIVLAVNIILGIGKSEPATYVKMIHNDAGMTFEADGEVAAFDITLSHGDDFDIMLTEDALIAMHNTELNETRIIIVLPEGNELFTAISDYKVKEVVALSRDGELNIVHPENLNLSPAYPNPFNPVTSLSLSLENSADIKVSVYNIAGQHVDVIHEGTLDAGHHSINWNAGNMPSGMYVIKADNGKTAVSQKVMLLK